MESRTLDLRSYV